MVNYCAAFNLNLFQSVLNESEHSLLFFLYIPHSSVLVLCGILNSDFCLAYRSFCSATAFHRTSWISETGLIDICLGDPNSQGMHGNERKRSSVLVLSIVMDLLFIFPAQPCSCFVLHEQGLGSWRNCASTYSLSFYGLSILWLYSENKPVVYHWYFLHVNKIPDYL